MGSGVGGDQAMSPMWKGCTSKIEISTNPPDKGVITCRFSEFRPWTNAATDIPMIPLTLDPAVDM